MRIFFLNSLKHTKLIIAWQIIIRNLHTGQERSYLHVGGEVLREVVGDTPSGSDICYTKHTDTVKVPFHTIERLIGLRQGARDGRPTPKKLSEKPSDALSDVQASVSQKQDESDWP